MMTPRQRSTRAAIAVATGLAVAAIGGGFALWSDSDTIDTAADITAGALSLDLVDTTGWTVDGQPVTADHRTVPGETATWAGDLAIGVTGAIEARLEVGDLPGATELDLASAAIDDDPIPADRVFTAADNGAVVSVVATATLPVGAGNHLQDVALSVGDLPVILTQITDGDSEAGDGGSGSVEDLLDAYNGARVAAIMAAGDILRIESYLDNTGLPDTMSLSDVLDAAEQWDMAYRLGEDLLAMTARDAIASLQSQHEAHAVSRDRAQIDLHDAGGVVSSSYAHATPALTTGWFDDVYTIDPVAEATWLEFSTTGDPGPFRVTGLDASHLPGYTDNGDGTVTFTPSIGTYTATWTLEEVDQHGNVLVSTPVELTLTFTE